MGTYLRSLKAFQIRAAISTENVLDDGQKVEIDSVADLLVDKPDKLRMEEKGDEQHRTFFYDGKTFTLFAQRLNFYATVPAPPTILELIDKLQEKFDIELPLVDMFDWGTPRAADKEINSAIDLGPSFNRGRELRTVRISAAWNRLANLDSERGLSATAKTGHHHTHGRGPSGIYVRSTPGTWRLLSMTRHSFSMSRRTR